MNNNVFYSTANPKMELEVNHDFKYLGMGEGKYSRSSSSGDFADTILVTSYGFVKPEGKVISKGVIVVFKELETNGAFWESKCTFVKGGKYIRMGGKKFCQVIQPIYSHKIYGKEWVEKTTKRGYTIPKYCMLKVLLLQRRRVNVTVSIYYFEEISDSTFHEFKKYYESKEAGQLTNSQKDFLANFDKRCEQAFQIVVK